MGWRGPFGILLLHCVDGVLGLFFSCDEDVGGEEVADTG